MPDTVLKFAPSVQPAQTRTTSFVDTLRRRKRFILLVVMLTELARQMVGWTPDIGAWSLASATFV